MPLLSYEVDIYPEDLLNTDVVFDDSKSWWAMYTLARHEKKLMRQLLKKKIAFYCPLIEKRWRTSTGRRRTSYVPLFPGYVFVRGDEWDRYNAVSTGCIARCIHVSEPEVLVSQLRNIRKAITSGKVVLPEKRIAAGQRVRVISGPLQGIEGVVVKKAGEFRLVMLVDFLQQGASVQIDIEDVELVG